jgi:hypothetical protein
MIPTKTELIDLLFRALWTGLQAFIGGLLAAGTGIVDISAIDSAQVAAIGAVLSLVKTYASNKLGTGTATERDKPVIGPAPVASLNAVPA